MERDRLDHVLRREFDALTAAVNPTLRVDAARQRGRRLRRRRHLAISLCSLLAILVPAVGVLVASSDQDASHLDIIGLPAMLETVAWPDPIWASAELRPRECRNPDYSVIVPAGWFTNEAEPDLAACTYLTTDVGNQGAGDSFLFSLRGEQLRIDAIPITIKKERNASAEALASDIIFADTGSRPNLVSGDYRPASETQLPYPIEGATSTYAFRLRTNNAADGSPDNSVRDYLVASNGSRAIWVRAEQSLMRTSDSYPLTVLLTSLRLAP